MRSWFDRLTMNEVAGGHGYFDLTSPKVDAPAQKECNVKPFWVYILRCSDGSYYTGHTDDLERRVGEHARGAIAGCYTASRLPVALVFSQAFSTRYEALSAERRIKGWSRGKKEAMMRGDWAEVARLARSRTNPVRGSTGSPRTG